MSDGFNHLDARGRAVMVDVTAKQATHRRAWTRCRVVNLSDARGRLGSSSAVDGVLTEARVAGLSGAKATASLIPLCHPLPLTDLSVEFSVGEHEVEVSASAETVGQTGVEMEALVACALAALTVLAAFSESDPLAAIEDLTLWEKTGGKSGDFRRANDTPDAPNAPSPGERSPRS